MNAKIVTVHSLRHFLPSAFALFTALLYGAVSCSTPAGPEPIDARPFVFRVSVKDGFGMPLSGIRVSAWNALSVTSLGKRTAVPTTLAQTTVGIVAPTPGRATLILSEFNGVPLDTLVDRQVLAAGTYAISFSVNPAVGTRVYLCRLAVVDTATGNEIHNSEITMVLWQPDAAIAILGWTDAQGIVEISDAALFPNVLDLPMLFETLNNSTPVGTFLVTDTVTVYLKDTTANRTTDFTTVISKGINSVNVVWTDPMTAGRTVRRPRPGQTISIHRISGRAAGWQLLQNYPNPFN